MLPLGKIMVKRGMTRKKFDQLKRLFNDQSKVLYRGDTTWDFVEFLTPGIQALNFRVFREETLASGDIGSNCWSTAQELARGGKPSNIFLNPMGASVMPVFSDGRFSAEVPLDPAR